MTAIFCFSLLAGNLDWIASVLQWMAFIGVGAGIMCVAFISQVSRGEDLVHALIRHITLRI